MSRILLCWDKPSQEIRQPLLARGTKAAGLEIVRFLTISGHAIAGSKKSWSSLVLLLGISWYFLANYYTI